MIVRQPVLAVVGCASSPGWSKVDRFVLHNQHVNLRIVRQPVLAVMGYESPFLLQNGQICTMHP